MIAGRGEVLRNFFFSDTLARLTQEASVTVLSVVDGEEFVRHFSAQPDRVLRLEDYPQPPLVAYLRTLTENAHDRWQWSAAAQNHWDLRDYFAARHGRVWPRRVVKVAARCLAWRPALRVLTALEQTLAYRLRPSRTFDELFTRLQPDLVFNGSQIHGMAAELPSRVAQRMGIRTACFLFSWDNLTSQSRIMVPYDDFLVWTDNIRREFRDIYPHIGGDHVHATGTPQLDFHFKPEYEMSREDLCRQVGIDPGRPFVLYTAGIDNHFYEEYLHVQKVAALLAEIDLSEKPQLVVRTYAKGTSAEMHALADRGIPDVVFPPVLWDAQWQTPRYEDLAIYSSLLRHTALGINAASTVSLELMLFDKPIINLRYDPTGTNLPWFLGYERHILLDHFRPIAESGATMVANSDEDLSQMLYRGLTQPEADASARKRFLAGFFSKLPDGQAGIRVAERLLALARQGPKSGA